MLQCSWFDLLLRWGVVRGENGSCCQDLVVLCVVRVYVYVVWFTGDYTEGREWEIRGIVGYSSTYFGFAFLHAIFTPFFFPVFIGQLKTF